METKNRNKKDAGIIGKSQKALRISKIEVSVSGGL
jgi:hypothetical protein